MATAAGGRGGRGGEGDTATGTNYGTITTGLSPDAQQNIGLAQAGYFHASLDDGTTLTSSIDSGSIVDGELASVALSSVTLSDGTVIDDAVVDGLTVSGTVSTTGESYTGTLVAGGIFRGLGTDTTAAAVTGLIVNGEWTTDIGGPNVNGADSDGLVVQSIGGGGGVAGAAAAKSLVLPLPGTNRGTGVELPQISMSFATGGTGGDGGDGGDAAASNYGGITTYGDYSRGILAQSIGGGGGNGGDGTASSTAIQSAGYDVQVAVGGGGGGGGSGAGASVTVVNGSSSDPATIATFGQYSPGIVAQSIGGGGGLGFEHADGGMAAGGSMTLGGFGVGGGGDVTLTGAATVTTYGDAAHAVVQKSHRHPFCGSPGPRRNTGVGPGRGDFLPGALLRRIMRPPPQCRRGVGD